jgi:MFS family permease
LAEAEQGTHGLMPRLALDFPTAAGGRDGALLLLARVLMSAQRALVGVIVPIYLARRGFSATELGGLFAIVALSAAAMSTLIGFAADRAGRKPFVVCVPLLSAGAGIAFAFTDHPAALFAAAALGTFGRGSGAGTAQVGPYQPAEQALLAGLVPDRLRNALFGLIASASAAGGLLGTVLAITPLSAARTGGQHVDAATYRPAFLAAAGLALLAGACALPVRERGAGSKVGGSSETTSALAEHETTAALAGHSENLTGHSGSAGEEEELTDAAALTGGVALGARGPTDAPRAARAKRLSAASRRLILQLWATNGVNGIAVGLFGPFITYWLYRRFGAGPATVGALYTAGNLITIATNQLAAPLAARHGTVRTVVAVRAAQALLLPVLAVMPGLAAAGAVYTLRLIVQRIGVSLRQSFVMGAAPPEERARVAALSQLPVQGISALSPTLSGYLFEELGLAFPFELAGALQLINAALFHYFFAPADRQRQPV